MEKRLFILGLLFVANLYTQKAIAQLNPLQAQYYTNRYLGNPAMAGIEKGLALSLSHLSQFSNIPGAPVTESLTADYGRGKIGLGLNLALDRAGLQRYVRALATYAYHLPLNNDGAALHFGLSAGIMDQRLANEDISGNSNDNLVGQYNEREAHFDGDVGIAFTTGKLMVEAALPNLRNLLWQDNGHVADLATFYTAASYKIAINDMELEPKVAYRGVSELSNLWDAGAQFSFAKKQLMLNAVYHSSGSTGFGIGMDYQQKYLIGLSYSMQTTQLSNYINGGFEVNLRVRFGR